MQSDAHYGNSEIAGRAIRNGSTLAIGSSKGRLCRAAPRLKQYERDVLEVIVYNDGISTNSMTKLSGWNYAFCVSARTYLKEKQFVTGVGKNANRYYATEAGKILLAIIIGKEAKLNASIA